MDKPAYRQSKDQNIISSINISDALENSKEAYNKIVVSKVKSPKQIKQSQEKSSFNINNPNMIRGGLIGVAVSALISWNAGRYSRLGIFRKRWKFIRNFIMVNKKPEMPEVFTNYHSPPLETVVKNFMCYSGQAGIGKSSHFMHLAFTQSGIRPALYISFKASGKDATFEQDIAEQVDFGGDCPGILSQIIRAVKKIHHINTYPERFYLKILLTHLFYLGAAYGVVQSTLDATYGMILFGVLGGTYSYYLKFIYPLFVQSLRRSCPLIIFDDINKIQHLNMLQEIVRYLQLLQNNMANVILVSPDQDTWSKLRREPGVKDRLRLRQIYYDHIFTAEALLKYLKDQQSFKTYMKYVNGNKLYSLSFVRSLIKELIGRRQVTLRRFSSILILNDEQQYEKLTQVLKQCSQGKMTTAEAVQDFTQILYDSQTRTMVSNLKSIKRQVKVLDSDFLQYLKLLLKKKKLPSDNQLGPHLKAYNIVRDLQSEYIFNGRFTFTVFNMAIQQYQKDMKDFKNKGQKQAVMMESTRLQGNQGGIGEIQDEIKGKNQESIKNWNNSNNLNLNERKQNETSQRQDSKRKGQQNASQTL